MNTDRSNRQRLITAWNQERHALRQRHSGAATCRRRGHISNEPTSSVSRWPDAMSAPISRCCGSQSAPTDLTSWSASCSAPSWRRPARGLAATRSETPAAQTSAPSRQWPFQTTFNACSNGPSRLHCEHGPTPQCVRCRARRHLRHRNRSRSGARPGGDNQGNDAACPDRRRRRLRQGRLPVRAGHTPTRQGRRQLPLRHRRPERVARARLPTGAREGPALHPGQPRPDRLPPRAPDPRRRRHLVDRPARIARRLLSRRGRLPRRRRSTPRTRHRLVGRRRLHTDDTRRTSRPHRPSTATRSRWSPKFAKAAK